MVMCDRKLTSENFLGQIFFNSRHSPKGMIHPFIQRHKRPVARRTGLLKCIAMISSFVMSQAHTGSEKLKY